MTIPEVRYDSAVKELSLVGYFDASKNVLSVVVFPRGEHPVYGRDVSRVLIYETPYGEQNRSFPEERLHLVPIAGLQSIDRFQVRQVRSIQALTLVFEIYRWHNDNGAPTRVIEATTVQLH